MVTHVSDTLCEQSGEQDGPSGEINSHQLSEEQVKGPHMFYEILAPVNMFEAHGIGRS